MGPVYAALKTSLGAVMAAAAASVAGMSRAELITFTLRSNLEWTATLAGLGEQAKAEELQGIARTQQGTTIAMTDAVLAEYTACRWREVSNQLKGLPQAEEDLRKWMADRKAVLKLTGAQPAAAAAAPPPPRRQEAYTAAPRGSDRGDGPRRGQPGLPTREARLYGALQALTVGNPQAQAGCRCCAFMGSVPPGTAAHYKAADCPQKEAAMRRLSIV